MRPWHAGSTWGDRPLFGTPAGVFQPFFSIGNARGILLASGGNEKPIATFATPPAGRGAGRRGHGRARARARRLWHDDVERLEAHRDRTAPRLRRDRTGGDEDRHAGPGGPPRVPRHDRALRRGRQGLPHEHGPAARAGVGSGGRGEAGRCGRGRGGSCRRDRHGSRERASRGAADERGVCRQRHEHPGDGGLQTVRPAGRREDQPLRL